MVFGTMLLSKFLLHLYNSFLLTTFWCMPLISDLTHLFSQIKIWLRNHYIFYAHAELFYLTLTRLIFGNAFYCETYLANDLTPYNILRASLELWWNRTHLVELRFNYVWKEVISFIVAIALDCLLERQLSE